MEFFMVGFGENVRESSNTREMNLSYSSITRISVANGIQILFNNQHKANSNLTGLIEFKKQI